MLRATTSIKCSGGTMSTFATKFQTGAAACAIAAAATLAPAVVAQADPAAPAPLAPVSQVVDSAFALAPIQFAQDTTNPWWLLPGDPAGFVQAITKVTPIQVIRGFFEQAYGWFSTLDETACIGGFGIHVGPYGSVSAGPGVGGC
jgi:hypothetical protein